MFAETTPTNGATAANGADVLVEPQIKGMQFAKPDETGFEFYEAWINYLVRINDETGAEITVFEFSAYGKAEAKKLERQSTTLDGAVQQALRDAGAKLMLSLSRDSKFKSWRESRK